MGSMETARLARSITRKGSMQSFLVGRLLVDRGRVDDFYRAYAYFRWVDDMIDEVLPTQRERVEFIGCQRELIRSLYSGEGTRTETDEERVLSDLIANDDGTNEGLRSFIDNMFAIIEFDTHRRGRPITREELDWYNGTLGTSVVDGLHYFIGHDRPASDDADRYNAAIAAHRTHLLRDMIKDIQNGFINLPVDVVGDGDPRSLVDDQARLRDWVRGQVEGARSGFTSGRDYIDGIEVLRCRIAANWYCLRFEGILDTIEEDGYELRAEYHELRRVPALMALLTSTTRMILQHIARSAVRALSHGRGTVSAAGPGGPGTTVDRTGSPVGIGAGNGSNREHWTGIAGLTRPRTGAASPVVPPVRLRSRIRWDPIE